jgi:hypothetical protein
MKFFLIATALTVAAISTPTLAADVGVSVTIGQPGFYGRIDIGDYPYPPPRVIYRQPRVIERIYVERAPIYMRVPPGHAKNWKKYCHQYDACGYPVYFVQDSWYEHDYVPNYREYHRDRHGDHGGDYYEDHRKENHGNSKKHDGNGHDKKKGNGQNH